MRFHTAHLLILVVLAGFVFALCRHPEALWAAVIPLLGGIFVVLPVLGTAELLGGRSAYRPQLSWLAVSFICLIAFVGSLCSVLVLVQLLDIAG